MGELEVVLQQGLVLGGLRRSSQVQRRLAKKAQPHFGESAPMRNLLELATLAAENESPVLLQGETGGGKGGLARWIPAHSTREAMPFLELRCGEPRGELLPRRMCATSRAVL